MGRLSTSEALGVFPNTRWSLVLTAKGSSTSESGAALEAICRSYWYPLYAYARRSGHSPHDAQDLTQEFFYQMLQKRWLDAADRDKGKLRTFLIVALRKFMSKEWRRASAQRRGGGQVHLQLDTVFAESRYAADAHASAAEDIFDRQWALTVLQLAMDRLQAETAAAGKPGDFDALKNCLTAPRGTIDYALIAQQLGISEGAARVAAHRLRKRFREIYREEIAHTLADGADLQAEMRYLGATLARELE
jgi:RNA polymerase sigma factor (sigma-70 family)